MNILLIIMISLGVLTVGGLMTASAPLFIAGFSLFSVTGLISILIMEAL